MHGRASGADKVGVHADRRITSARVAQRSAREPCRACLRTRLAGPSFALVCLGAGLLLIGLLGVGPGEPAATDERVAILVGRAGPHQAAAESLQRHLKKAGIAVQTFVLPEDGRAESDKFEDQVRTFRPSVIAAGGGAATLRALDAVPKVPVVFFMVPNVHDAPFVAKDYRERDRIAGVTSDIDPAALIAWALRTCPGLGRLAVPCSEHTDKTVTTLVAAGKRKEVRVMPVRARQDEFPKLIDKLNESEADGVLMIPDARVYNSPNVQRLLLWGVRQKKPVWTFSEKVVKAGAYGGVCVDAAAVGRQAAGLVARVLEGEKPESIGIHYADDPTQAVNVHTAAMLGLGVELGELSAKVRRFGDRR